VPPNRRTIIDNVDDLRRAVEADPDLEGLAGCIDEVQKAVRDVWSKDYQPWFTDHGPNHSRRVADYAMRLTKFPMLHDSLRLTALEYFVLWAASWLHDVGMQDLMAAGPLGEIDGEGYGRVRHLHPERSSANILGGWEGLGLPKGDAPLAEAIAGVARAHGTKYYRDTVISRLGQNQVVRNQNVRTRLLAALLLFADELDLHYQRAQVLPGWFENNSISEAHAFKHQCVVAVNPICERDGRIAVELELAFTEDLPAEARQLVQRWIEVKLLKQMSMVEPEIVAGFESHARFDRVIRTSIRTALTRSSLISDAALAVIRADTAYDDLINHRNALSTALSEVEDSGIVMIVPRQPETDLAFRVRNDGQSDLAAAVIAKMIADGRRVFLSRRGELNLGATASDVMSEWVSDFLGEAENIEPDETEKAAQLDRIAHAVEENSESSFLFAIIGAEYIDQAELGWLASEAVPRLRAASPNTAFLLTSSSRRSFAVPDAAVTVVPMSDLESGDVADYLARFVAEAVAVAESRTHDTYEMVKKQAQEHVLGQRR
jgi:hypothetical protein